MSHFCPAVIILAAGRSERMGCPKLLLPWAGTSILGHLLRQWAALEVEHIAVVCGVDDKVVQGELDRLAFPTANRIFNSSPERGMFSSIQCAAQWTGWEPFLSHFVITLGDQPHLRLDTLRLLLEYSAAYPANICQPQWEGRPRHPVVLPANIFHQLQRSSFADLKQFLAAHMARLVLREINDPGLGLDLDRPEDYRRALEL